MQLSDWIFAENCGLHVACVIGRLYGHQPTNDIAEVDPLFPIRDSIESRHGRILEFNSEGESSRDGADVPHLRATCQKTTYRW
jgi:hypothetical protein